MSSFEHFDDISVELRKLMHRSFDDSLSDEEFDTLQSALKSNREARLHYSALAQFHAKLVATKQAMALCREVQHEYQVLPIDQKPYWYRRWHPGKQWRKVVDAIQYLPRRTAATLLAAGLGLGCAVGIVAATWVGSPPQFLPVPWNWTVESDVVARVETTDNAKWQPLGDNVTIATRGLRVGEMIRLEKGLMQIAYRNGVSVIIEGPAVYEVRSEHGGKLFSGRQSLIVPTGNANFLLETSVGKFQLGPGRFGLNAKNSAAFRHVTFYGLSGGRLGSETAQFESSFGVTSSLATGDAFQFDDMGQVERVVMSDADGFHEQMPKAQKEAFGDDKIYLGNLFDDSKTTSLTQAMQSDKYNAGAEVIDLGVAAIHDGGLDVDVKLAEDGVLFNFCNVGGGGARVSGLPGNDTHRSVDVAIPIRTTGELLGHDIADGSLPKVEEGIGIDANKLLTFDLEEIRGAGQLEGRPMHFVADRAGLNDREFPLKGSLELAHANMIVIVSTEDQVLSAYLNGEPVAVDQHANVFSLNVDELRATKGVRYGDDFVRFDVPIPANARFLSLVSTQLEDANHDHIVYSGARLEIEPAPQNTAAE